MELSGLRRRLALGITSVVAAGFVVVMSPTVASAAAAPVAAAAPAAAAAAAAVPAAKPPIQERPASLVTSDALPTTQIDGVAWAQKIVGNVVYVGGSFSTARPAKAAPGVNTTPRSNLLAYDLTTGNLITTFAPVVNGQIRAMDVSPDKTTLYIGGDFTTVDGEPRNRIAAINLASGKVTKFGAGANNSVYSIVATANAVYLGGEFTQINGLWRLRLAAVVPATGGVLKWTPEADRVVRTMALNPSGTKLVVGGSFQYLNKSTLAEGLGAVDPTTGATYPWNDGIASFGPTNGFTSVSTDGTYMYATTFQYGPPPGWTTTPLEGTLSMDPETGQRRWLADCHGDTYGSYPISGVVYTISHAHNCENIGGFPEKSLNKYQPALAFSTDATGTVGTNTQVGYQNKAGEPSPSIINWFPFLQQGTYTGQSQAAWSVTGNADYVVMGGEFPNVNSAPQQGLVRFAVPSKSTRKQGPRLSGTGWAPTAAMAANGTVRVDFPANWDRDNYELTYQLIRNGDTANPVASVKGKSTYWNLPAFTVTDPQAPANPGATRYSVRAVDPDGNSTLSSEITPFVSTNDSPYALAVKADGASRYWRMGESTGTVLHDSVGAPNGTAVLGVTWGESTSAIKGDSNTSGGFARHIAQGLAISEKTSIAAGSPLTIELWFQNLGEGGGIASFGNSNSTARGNQNLILYMTSERKLVWGVVSGGTLQWMTTPNGYWDNGWHHVAVTISSSGFNMYVDGVLTNGVTTVTSVDALDGYWRLGGDYLGWWPRTASRDYLWGNIDEFAVYPKALTAEQIARHAAKGGLPVQAVNAPPVASFTASTAGLVATTDASASTDSDGVVTGYSWNFGDGTAAVTGVKASHTYAASGTYTVTLTATDDLGATNTVTKQITVAVNQPPKAAFTTAATDLTVAADGSTSTDADGTVASYSWSWGDGTADTTGVKASHTYAKAGTYTIALTATDNLGATNTVTKQVTVAAANQPPKAAFTAAPTDLTVAVDGSTSTDADGAVASYSWNFGDGTAAVTGATASHTYTAAGTYTVTLTVTDDKGATGQATQQVTVTSAPVVVEQGVVASDTFQRTSASGWGSADTGGPWTLVGSASRFTVDPTTGGGMNLVTAGSGLSAYLSGVSTTNVSTAVDVRIDKQLSTTGLYVSLDAQRIGTSNYRLKARLAPDGGVVLTLVRVINGAETTLRTFTVAGVVFAPGETIRMKFTVTTDGASSSLAGSVWKGGETEPAAAQITAADTTAALQAPGGVGLMSYVGSTATSVPVKVSFSNFTATTVK